MVDGEYYVSKSDMGPPIRPTKLRVTVLSSLTFPDVWNPIPSYPPNVLTLKLN